MDKAGQVAIIDLGGQYCHLIARRLRDLGLDSFIFDPEVDPQSIAPFAGVILSGGPQSVYNPGAPTIDPAILSLKRPVLGICYGHQLLAKILGGEVKKRDGEYGFARLNVTTPDSLFRSTPKAQQVWMSHSDAVETLPPGAEGLAWTERCGHAAFADFHRRFFGVQFHPEVVHTDSGPKILENFARNICGIKGAIGPAGQIKRLLEQIRQTAAGRSVFFLVSGGVDSTVAFVLCAKALGTKKVLGLYVDTGLMRAGETDELRENLKRLGIERRVRIWEASKEFLQQLKGKTDPEEKRQIIGRLFVEIQSKAMRKYGVDPDGWMLGQGTIYPDTIESGGKSGRAALIKTHHNRCEEIRELIRQGRVIEPLAEFYKDEVRQIGKNLGLARRITDRWPFPGPGLAIRCICTQKSERAKLLSVSLEKLVRRAGYIGVLLPLKSVGVQGDSRTYRMVVALQKNRGSIGYAALRELSSSICNVHSEANRVVVLLAGKQCLESVRINRRTITLRRLRILREADRRVRLEVERAGFSRKVWQFPVVLAPIAFEKGESIILRPVNSEDGMTASFAGIPLRLLKKIATRVASIPGVDAVFLDATNKPPATIEWE